MKCAYRRSRTGAAAFTARALPYTSSITPTRYEESFPVSPVRQVHFASVHWKVCPSCLFSRLREARLWIVILQILFNWKIPTQRRKQRQFFESFDTLATKASFRWYYFISNFIECLFASSRGVARRGAARRGAAETSLRIRQIVSVILVRSSINRGRAALSKLITTTLSLENVSREML